MLTADELRDLVIKTLEEHKGIAVQGLDVRDQTDITDYLVVCTGGSDRHLRALADSVVTAVKEQGIRPLGEEGQRSGEWVLVDLGDVVVHLMRAETREYYNLEKLWGELPRTKGQTGHP